MTEKRFTINGKEIIQDKQVWCMANSEHCADVIATAINELINKNEQLKQVSQDYEDNVSNWFIENWHTLSDEQKQSAHLELGIDIEYGDD